MFKNRIRKKPLKLTNILQKVTEAEATSAPHLTTEVPFCCSLGEIGLRWVA